MTYTYTIEFPAGFSPRVDGESFSSQEEASAAIALAMGWTDIALTESFCVDACDERGDAVEAYESQAELSAHPDGDPRAPRIVCRKAAD
jgi:hypothetical protein